ncbi:MAG: Holliday junction resolvase RuvX [Candidatus Nanopelagicus sp.]
MSRPITLGRRIGFDYGEKRIGVATSNNESILVSPHATILNDAQLKIKLSEILDEVQPIYVVVGDPKHLSGRESDKSRSAMAFALQIRKKYAGSIYLVDERYSTVSSNNKLKELGISERDGRSIIDQIAAISILEAALQNERAGIPIGEIV